MAQIARWRGGGGGGGGGGGPEPAGQGADSWAGAGATLVERVISSTQLFLEDYGWAMVFTAVAVCLALPHLKKAKQRFDAARAQDPRRVAVLDQDRARVRAQQVGSPASRLGLGLLMLVLFGLVQSASPNSWTMHVWQGRPYWVNEQTGQTQWERPVAPAVPTAPAAPAASAPYQRPSRSKQPAAGASASSSTATAFRRPRAPSSPLDSSANAAGAGAGAGAGAAPAFHQKDAVVTALKQADSRLDELQTALDAAERALARERQLRVEAEDNSTAVAEELTQSLREAEDDAFELRRQLTAERQSVEDLEAKVKQAARERLELREKVARIDAERRRMERLPQQVLFRFFGGLVGVSGERRGVGGGGGGSTVMTGGGAKSGVASGIGGGGGVSVKQLNRTIARMRDNMTALVEAVQSKEEIIQDLATQIADYQEEAERRKFSYEEIKRRIGSVLADRDRLLDLVDALSANTCDMAVKISILQRFIQGITEQYQAREIEWTKREEEEEEKQQQQQQQKQDLAASEAVPTSPVPPAVQAEEPVVPIQEQPTVPPPPPAVHEGEPTVVEQEHEPVTTRQADDSSPEQAGSVENPAADPAVASPGEQEAQAATGSVEIVDLDDPDPDALLEKGS